MKKCQRERERELFTERKLKQEFRETEVFEKLSSDAVKDLERACFGFMWIRIGIVRFVNLL